MIDARSAVKAGEIFRPEFSKTLSYNPETGLFTRYFVTKPSRLVETTDARGYIVIRVATASGSKLFRAARLAWFYFHGEWPSAEVDHENRIRTDNRILNLRDSTISQNRQNMVRKPNRVGITGVIFRPDKNRYLARIYSAGTLHNLGYFRIKEEAQAAYLKAREKLHGEFAPIDSCG